MFVNYEQAVLFDWHFFAKNMISMNGLKLREAEQEAIILDRSICTRQPTPLKGLEYSQTPKLTKNEYSLWHYPYNAIQSRYALGRSKRVSFDGFLEERLSNFVLLYFAPFPCHQHQFRLQTFRFSRKAKSAPRKEKNLPRRPYISLLCIAFKVWLLLLSYLSF